MSGNIIRLPRPPKAVVFDLDGTLIDSEALVLEAYMAAADESSGGRMVRTLMTIASRSGMRRGVKTRTTHAAGRMRRRPDPTCN